MSAPIEKDDDARVAAALASLAAAEHMVSAAASAVESARNALPLRPPRRPSRLYGEYATVEQVETAADWIEEIEGLASRLREEKRLLSAATQALRGVAA